MYLTAVSSASHVNSREQPYHGPDSSNFERYLFKIEFSGSRLLGLMNQEYINSVSRLI